MDVRASDVYAYYHPKPCPLRVYLRQQQVVPEAEPGPYQQWLFRRGLEHEINHCKTLPNVCDLSAVPTPQKMRETLAAMSARAATIYQGRLEADIDLNGPVHVIGEPDFLVLLEGGYSIRDSKSIKELGSGHPEVRAQLQIYGWLYEQVTGQAPAALEVHCGTGRIESLAYKRQAAWQEINQLFSLKAAGAEPYSPFGWSKCSACGFFDHCRQVARQARDVALLPDVEQWLARALRDSGIQSYDDLLAWSKQHALTGFSDYDDNRRRRQVSADRAQKILRAAQAFVDGHEILVQKPILPPGSNYVMLDLEGLPPQFDEEEWVFLWGLQVFGNQPGPYLAAFAPDRTKERATWEQFLAIAQTIFAQHGDRIPFVHWHHYERTKLEHYAQHFGDSQGIAAQVIGNLCDLLPITKASFAFPLPSYSLKMVEEYLGFHRSCPGLHGDWAMAQYVALPEAADAVQRDQMTAEILTYNREDLAATWHVLQWLLRQ